MQTSSFEHLTNILAIRLDNIGDVVMTSPALRALRRAYPGARISLMASPAGSQVAPLLPWVDRTITWEAVWQDIAKKSLPAPQKEYSLIELLKKQRFDAAFIFTSFSQSPYPPAYACTLAGIPVRVGQSREFGGGLLSHWVKPPADHQYQADRNLHLLREVGIPVESNAMELHVSAADQHSASALLASAGIGPEQPFVVLAPGASASARRYDETRFAEVSRRLVSETHLPVVLVGSQREIGAFPALEALAEQPDVVQPNRLISLLGKTSLPEMAGIIQRSRLLIGNNSGAMHIASALDRPMVILYSGTELLEQFAPPDGKARFLNRPTHCTPCHGFQCPYHLECLEVPADEVFSAAMDLIRQDFSAMQDLSATTTAVQTIDEPIKR